MAWLQAEYEFGSLFSYRIPDFSTQYAISSLLPGPSTIKLATIATAIETEGKPSYGADVFGIVKSANVRLGVPSSIAVSNLLIKRLKQEDPTKQKPKTQGRCEDCGREDTALWEVRDGRRKLCRRCAIQLMSTFAVRGYVHYSEPLKIYVEVAQDRQEEIASLMKKIRRFGTSDSLVYCRSVEIKEPADNCVGPEEKLDGTAEVTKGFLLIPTRDINRDPEVKFEHVNIYSGEKPARGISVFVNRFYKIPIISERQGKNYFIYQISESRQG